MVSFTPGYVRFFTMTTKRGAPELLFAHQDFVAGAPVFTAQIVILPALRYSVFHNTIVFAGGFIGLLFGIFVEREFVYFHLRRVGIEDVVVFFQHLFVFLLR